MQIRSTQNFDKVWFSLREFGKTHVIFTPGALMVGGELQFVLHFEASGG